MNLGKESVFINYLLMYLLIYLHIYLFIVIVFFVVFAFNISTKTKACLLISLKEIISQTDLLSQFVLKPYGFEE